MAAAAYLITANPGIDVLQGSLNGAQLIEDSGVITDLDGGFDTATITALVNSSSNPAIGESHPTVPNLFLFGISPKPLPGGSRQITLSYKGVSGRALGSGEPPAAGSQIAKFSYGIRMTERSAAVGEMEGTVDGVDLATKAVSIMQPQQTVRISWMANSRISANAFNISNGRSTAQYGAIDENFYSTITNPVYNYPHGWVPIESSSEQAYPGVNIWANSITYVGVPKYSAS
ncbi:MAG: hypothetical protein EOP87_00185 [Verrucomicrobiaceae bacterium]|nr:MAG: hypothetical protein EOP87_00185 [Verrucomicrobiaceae bacterium]